MSEHPEAIKHYPRSTQLLIKKLHNRVNKRNKNVLSVIVGSTGSGKSYDALSLMVGLHLYQHGSLCDDYTFVKHCNFKAIEFMGNMNDEDNMKRGDVWIWDEAGIEAGNQDYNTLKNKVISWFAQTCRNQNQIIIFTLPTLGMIAPQVRKLLHYYFEAAGVDSNRKIGIIKPLEMQYNTRRDKIYYHRLNMIDKEGYIDEIELAGCPLVHKSLLDMYEKKKKSFTKDLNIEIQQILQMLEAKKNKDLTTPMKPTHKDIYILYHTYSKKGIDIAAKLNKKQPSISAIMSTMDRRYPDWRYNPNLLGNLDIYRDYGDNGAKTATPST